MVGEQGTATGRDILEPLSSPSSHPRPPGGSPVATWWLYGELHQYDSPSHALALAWGLRPTMLLEGYTHKRWSFSHSRNSLGLGNVVPKARLFLNVSIHHADALFMADVPSL